MNTQLALMADLIDAEFDGDSWNGPSLMATLEKLGAEEASSEATWEGYSAWEIAIHCALCEWTVARDLGVDAGAWSWGEGWFPAPTDRDETAWKRDLDRFRVIHRACMTAIRGLDESRFEEKMPTWKSPWGKVIAWLCTHYAFHGAQIRSMGLPSLRTAREA